MVVSFTSEGASHTDSEAIDDLTVAAAAAEAELKVQKELLEDREGKKYGTLWSIERDIDNNVENERVEGIELERDSGSETLSAKKDAEKDDETSSLNESDNEGGTEDEGDEVGESDESNDEEDEEEEDEEDFLELTSYAELRKIIDEMDDEDDTATWSLGSGLLPSEDPRSATNELFGNTEPPMIDDIVVNETDALTLAGTISSVIEGTVVVQAAEGSRTLQEGCLLVLEDRSILGVIEDIFGPVQAPLYVSRLLNLSGNRRELTEELSEGPDAVDAVRRESVLEEDTATAEKAEDPGISADPVAGNQPPQRDQGRGSPAKIQYASSENLAAGLKIYSVDRLSDYVHPDELRVKGYDADIGPEGEPVDPELQFSDDEQEAEYKRSLKKSKRKLRSASNGKSADRVGILPVQGIGIARTKSDRNNAPNASASNDSHQKHTNRRSQQRAQKVGVPHRIDATARERSIHRSRMMGPPQMYGFAPIPGQYPGMYGAYSISPGYGPYLRPGPVVLNQMPHVPMVNAPYGSVHPSNHVGSIGRQPNEMAFRTSNGASRTAYPAVSAYNMNPMPHGRPAPPPPSHNPPAVDNAPQSQDVPSHHGHGLTLQPHHVYGTNQFSSETGKGS